jgi:hypothetical protein
MFESIGRSWNLIRASARIVREDKELMLFPVLSAVAGVVVLATFLVPLVASGTFERLGRGGSGEGLFYVWMFLLYLVLYFVVIFFNTALIGAAMIRLDGGNPTVRDGLSIATSRIGSIFGYAVISATVGVLLNMLEERLGVVGRFVVALIGTAWSVATFLVVPVLVTRDIGPLAAVKESAGLLRRTWGENLAGGATVGLVFGLVSVALGLLGFGLAGVLFSGGSTGAGVFVAVVTVLALVGIAVVQSALTGVFAAALYRYAMTGQAPDAFGGEAMASAFTHRR